MAKYTEAYNDITNRNIDIMHVRKECAADPAAYERNYRGHLFCPGCGVVPLTLVHDEGRLYFRGHPNAVHSTKPIHIAFLALSKNFSTSLFSSPYTCYLRSSTYLVAHAD